MLPKLIQITYNTLQPSADMSGFEVLGAIATIIQFVEYGVSFSKKVVAVYKGRGELKDLHKLIREYRQQNDEFQTNLRLRAPHLNSSEALLNEIAEECCQTANDLLSTLGQLTLQDNEKSRMNAIKVTWEIERRKKDILAKQQQLENLRERCHEQLSVVIK